MAAERELETVKNQNEVLSGQTDVLKADKTRLEEDLGKARKKTITWNGKLKAPWKQSRKDKKLLLQAEDRSFQFGFDEAVIKVHGLALDHKLLFEEDMEDPIGRETTDVAPEVSSDPDPDLSE